MPDSKSLTIENRLSLDSGIALVEYPDHLSDADCRDLLDWLDIVRRRIYRQAMPDVSTHSDGPMGGTLPPRFRPAPLPDQP